ncbi:MAG: 2'-5' RNA ligase family protein [Caldilineaceae bacterium]|nr:2'-5' RNA ligase family protein [Caldilineaceae bacterium]
MNTTNSIIPRMSIQILLPDAVDRRFRRRVKTLPGASWPAWGGHVTLVPAFVPTCPPREVFDRVAQATGQFVAFRIRLAEAVAEGDITRPHFHTVFIQLDDPDSEDHQTLARLQKVIFAALAPVRDAAKPQLDAVPFKPHLTLALGVGDSEAAALVNALRSEPMQAEFLVDAVWLVLTWPAETHDSRVDRVPVPLAKPALPPSELPPGTLSD